VKEKRDYYQERGFEISAFQALLLAQKICIFLWIAIRVSV